MNYELPHSVRCFDSSGERSGMTLIVVVSFLAALFLLAGTLLAVLSANIKGTAHYHGTIKARHFAEAGVSAVLAELRSSPNRLLQAVETVTVTAPAGITFDPITNLYRTAERKNYLVTITGRSGDARCTIEAVIGRNEKPLIGVFGTDQVTIKPGMGIYSYYASEGQPPTSSTGEATVGSNVEVAGQPGHTLDGTCLLGETGGTPAVYSSPDLGAEEISVPEIEADPLGVVGGPLADLFAQVALTNDNASAIGGTQNPPYLTIDSDTTLSTGDYYVDDIHIHAHKVLTIDATGGPVRIFLTGGMNLAAQSDLEVSPTLPSNFQLFSSSSANINLVVKDEFVGFIYAPLATVSASPNTDIFGSIYGQDVYLAPGGDLYADLDLLNTFTLAGNDVVALFWKELR